MTPRTPSAVLFDLDGTLIDSIALIESSYRHTLQVHGTRKFDRDEWLAGLGRPLKWQFAQWTSDADEIALMIATYRAHNNVHHDAMVKPFEGAIEALQDLKRRGVSLGVVTSKMHAGALRGISRGGFDGLIDIVIGCDDVAEPKPAAEPALKALTQLKLAPELACMVGDSPHDIQCGQLAGTSTAAVMWGPFPRKYFDRVVPDRWLEHPRELADLVGNSKVG